jgi:hypothetical protein
LKAEQTFWPATEQNTALFKRYFVKKSSFLPVLQYRDHQVILDVDLDRFEWEA